MVGNPDADYLRPFPAHAIMGYTCLIYVAKGLDNLVCYCICKEAGGRLPALGSLRSIELASIPQRSPVSRCASTSSRVLAFEVDGNSVSGIQEERLLTRFGGKVLWNAHASRCGGESGRSAREPIRVESTSVRNSFTTPMASDRERRIGRTTFPVGGSIVATVPVSRRQACLVTHF